MEVGTGDSSRFSSTIGLLFSSLFVFGRGIGFLARLGGSGGLRDSSFWGLFCLTLIMGAGGLVRTCGSTAS